MAEKVVFPCPACHLDQGDLSNLLDDDAMCLNCGHRLWSDPEQPELPPFDRFDRMVWVTLAIVSTQVVWMIDRSPVGAIIWLLGVLAFGQLILPPMFRWIVGYVNEGDRFWLAVICGWGMVAGLPAGILCGVLSPCLLPGVPAWVGGIVGLIVGPLIAAVEGLILASLVSSAVWLFTGKSLAREL